MGLVLGVTLLLCACGDSDIAKEPDGIVCTAELRPGIMLTVLDNATDAPASCGAQALITEGGGYSETVQNPAVPGCIDTLLLSGAAERPGTYNVRVSKAGYQDAVLSNLVVASDVCHVITVERTVRLTR